MKEKMTTMRRNKVIADSKDQRDATSVASDQLDKLNEISLNLTDTQASTELVSEVVENKGNEIIQSVDEVNTSLGDTNAGIELTAEVVEKGNEKLSTLNDTASKISDKIAKLAQLLDQKIESTLAPSTNTGLAVIEDAIPVTIVPDSGQEEVEKVLPTIPNNDPDADFIPQVESPEQRKEDENDKKDLSNKISALLGTTKEGFKKSLSVSDRIASMLFKYTVSAAIEAAKMAALVIGIVIGIDLLMIHFQHWSEKFNMSWDLFNKDFTAFSKETGTWGPLLQSIFDAADGIKTAWDKGDFGGLVIAIAEGVGKVIYNLGELIQLGMAKLTAAIIRLIPGMDETATNIEGAALQGFQERSGAKLNEEDQTKVAQYQSNKIKNGENVFDKINKGKTYISNWIRGVDNKQDLTSVDEREAEIEKLKNMSEEDRLEALKKGNEARAALIRTEKFMEGIDPENKAAVQNANKAFEDVKNLISDPAINETPATKKELEARYNKLEAVHAKLNEPVKVEPESSTASPESKQVQQIEANISKKEEKTKADQSTLINTNNVVNNSKIIHNMNPVTSTSAPGIFGSVRVN